MGWKKWIMAGFGCLMLTGIVVGCGGSDASQPNAKGGQITVVSREDGSGTRGAFIELMKIEEKDKNGKKVDKTTKEAVIANKTDVAMTTVAGDKNAIGYISLGSLNDTVKALKIDSVEPTAENVKNGSYKVARPFNIAVKGEAQGLAKDFIDFIMSEEGQLVVAKGYIPVNDKAAKYNGTKIEGKIVVGGSSSVTPIMEKLAEAYKQLNPQAAIEVQMNDSTSGMKGAMEGTCDIGMASRALKDSEKKELKEITIANDGIAIIVNKENPVNDLTSAQIKDIFTGATTTWTK